MHPFLQFGSVKLPSYFTLILIGILISFIVSLVRAKNYNIKKSNLTVALIFIIVGLIFGAKIFFALTTIPDIIKHLDILSSYPGEVILYMFSGWVFFGGLIGALIFLKMFAFQFNQNFNSYLSLLIPVFPLAHAFGRIGCFLAGCCYGVEYDGVFCVIFPDSAIVEGVNLFPRFPVQLLEAFLNFILFILLLILSKRKISILGVYFVSYSFIRFVLEFLRGDEIRGVFLYLSSSQWISIILFLIGIYLLTKKRAK